MTTPINEHNMLTLDFWRDTVTYEGKTVPTGTLGCETLNIPDEVIEKLSKLCPRVNLLLETMNQETPNAALLKDAGKAAEEILLKHFQQNDQGEFTAQAHYRSALVMWQACGEEIGYEG